MIPKIHPVEAKLLDGLAVDQVTAVYAEESGELFFKAGQTAKGEKLVKGSDNVAPLVGGLHI